MSVKALSRNRLEARVHSDELFGSVLKISAWAVVGLLLSVVIMLTIYSQESIGKFGVGFLSTSEWDPVAQVFGAFPYIFGTVVTSLIGLVLAFPLAISSAMFVVMYAPRHIGEIVAAFIELLAAIPSVVFGIWGIFVLVPLMRSTIDPFLQQTIGKLPIVGSLFPTEMTFGQNLFTAGVILAIMILPTIMSVARAVIAQAPQEEIKAYYALGATKWEVIRNIVWPHARGGVLAAVMLGLARALGEKIEQPI